ncbi:hypothetical protein SLA2020_090440 [Shorea laevis]
MQLKTHNLEDLSLRKGSFPAGSGMRRMRMPESGSGEAVRQMEDGYSKQSAEGDAKSKKGKKDGAIGRWRR